MRMHLANSMARILMSSGLMVAGTSTVAHAGVWNVAGQGSIGASHDDNVRLSTQNPIADWSGIADVAGVLSYQDDAVLFSATPRLLAIRYDLDRAYNRTEQYLTLQAQKTTETGSSNLSLSGTQDTTLTSEPGLTGLAEVNKQRRLAALTVGGARNLSERFALNGQLSASASRYVDAQQTGLIDYDYGSAQFSTSYAITARSRLTLQLSAGALQVPDNESYDKVNMAATLGYRLQLAPRWRVNVSAGPSQIRTRDRDQTGEVYDATLTHDAELTSFNLSISKDVTPNGFGLFSRREQLRLSATRSLGERWAVDGSAALVRNRNVLSDLDVEQAAVNYTDLTGSVRWRITPTWDIRFSAGYARQRVGDTLPAERQYTALNINWNGQVRALH